MHMQQQRIRSPDAFRLTDVNKVKHDSKHQRPSFRFIHITSEQPIHIAGIRSFLTACSNSSRGNSCNNCEKMLQNRFIG